METPMKLVLALFPLAAGGCAFGSGDAFADLSASLDAELVALPDRDVGEGWQKLSNDYEVRFTRAAIAVESIDLLDAGGGGGGDGATFDPANPPPGYSLCHNGHCHADDGRLVSYEEIAAELAGGGSGPSTVVSLTGADDLDLLAGASVDLDCDPGCGLPQATIARASLVPAQLALEATVRDGRQPPRLEGELELRAELPAAGADEPVPPSFDAAVDLPADREHEPDVTLSMRVEASAALLDGIDMAELTAADGVIDLVADENEDGLVQFMENLAELELGAEVSR
jgi:hypothetical protein